MRWVVELPRYGIARTNGNLMSTTTIDESGLLHIPSELGQRRGLLPNTKVRIVETGCGVLVVPLDDEPMPRELVEELALWQSAGAATWDRFPYEDAAP